MTNQSMKVFFSKNKTSFITTAVRGTCQGKLYKRLDFESLKFRRCLRHYHFVRIKATKTSNYLYQLIFVSSNAYSIRCPENTEFMVEQKTMNDFFRPFNIAKWGKKTVYYIILIDTHSKSRF